MGVLPSARGRPGAGMEWRVTIELNGADGTKQTHEVARGGGSDSHSPLDPLGLTLDDGKTLLAGVQRHLVQRFHGTTPITLARPPDRSTYERRGRG